MEKGRRTGTLTRINRPLESFLAEAGFDGDIIDKTLPWGNQLERDARFWMTRGEVRHERGRISKSDAARMLKAALAAKEGS